MNRAKLRNCLIWSGQVGVWKDWMAWILRFNVCIPSLSTVWPRNFTCFLRTHLLSLIMRPVNSKRYKTWKRTLKCSLESFETRITSSRKQNTCLSSPKRTELIQSINHGGHTPGGALPRLPYGATPGGHASRVSMEAPFLYRVTPSRRHRGVGISRSHYQNFQSHSEDCCIVSKNKICNLGVAARCSTMTLFHNST